LTASASFSALGSKAVVVTSEDDDLAAAVQAVQWVVGEFDVTCSRFREDSELSRVNRAAGRSIRVSPLMVKATLAAVRAAQLTDGDVDPTLGAALVSLGYDRDFDLVLGGLGAAADRGAGGQRAPERTLAFASVDGWRTIRVDASACTLGVGAGVSLDLGATAKALAADHAASRAIEGSTGGVLVSLGGDIATAGEAPAGGWRVRVTDDHRSDASAPGQWITLQSGGLATSSTAVRTWRSGDGELVHHLLDPSTRLPAAGGWRTVSVTAATCLDANIASTAAIVRGQRAAAWLQSIGLPSRLVSDDGLALYVAGWPPDGDDLEPAGCVEAPA
jgi:FAD:protein FMN transferase